MEIYYKFEDKSGSVYTDYGCSPETLKKIIDWLDSNKDRIVSVNIALYLFNNKVLYTKLKEMADAGCNVVIYSIPLEGYDDTKPINIINYDNGIVIGRKTKYELAEEIYRDVLTGGHANLNFRVVPHMYLRSSRVKPFSRGNMPYSLHCKSLCIECNDNIFYAGITSSNLAVRDAGKIELSIFKELTQSERVSVFDFYEGLNENSISLFDFDESEDYSHYNITMRERPLESGFMFTAPFYNNSSFRFEEIITSMIRNANRRIVVCAQHICSYNYTFDGLFSSNREDIIIRRDGFLTDVLKGAERGVETQFLSQTYVDENGDSHGCRKPQNIGAFKSFILSARVSGCNYYVNSNVHSKFIIIDDIVLITTCNFTPTQFIYLPNVNIDTFDNIPSYSYSGIHCEFGAYSIIRNQEFADLIMEQFFKLTQLKDTTKFF